jgi:predicted Zn-dependent peptidase
MAFTLGRLDEAALAIEKRIVTNVLREREQTRSFVLWRRRQQALYGANHPFTPAEDAARALDGIELQGLQGFFQRTYRPDNARPDHRRAIQRARAKLSYAADLERSASDNRALADLLARTFGAGHGSAWLGGVPEALSAVSADDVLRVAGE